MDGVGWVVERLEEIRGRSRYKCIYEPLHAQVFSTEKKRGRGKILIAPSGVREKAIVMILIEPCHDPFRLGAPMLEWGHVAEAGDNAGRR